MLSITYGHVTDCKLPSIFVKTVSCVQRSKWLPKLVWKKGGEELTEINLSH